MHKVLRRDQRRLAVIGAGPKAAAIVARLTALRELGETGLPEVVVYEADHIGSAWSGRAGFSNGFLSLCTPGEKDVGFPYGETTPWGGVSKPLAPHLFSRFSFSAFLVATGRMVHWVDKARPHPSHAEWSSYLEWVFDQAGVEPVRARIRTVERQNGRWELTSPDRTIDGEPFDGVLFTGSGKARTIGIGAGMPRGRVFDAETFWSRRERIKPRDELNIAVAGNGGAAGTIVAWLSQRFAEYPRVHIYSISPAGTLFLRGDGFSERRWFSDPGEWSALSLESRRNLIGRTEAGVISQRNKAVIDSASNIIYTPGKATRADWDKADGSMNIALEDGLPLNADYLVMAGGFDPWSLLDIVRARGLAKALRMDDPGRSLRAELELSIERDLSLPSVGGIPPGLHVPALAGLAVGPGMANLGCLGLMAKAVLGAYSQR